MTVRPNLIPNLTEADYVNLRIKAWELMEGWGWEKRDGLFGRRRIDVFDPDERREEAEALFQWMVQGLSPEPVTPMVDADLYGEEQTPATGSETTAADVRSTEPPTPSDLYGEGT